MSVNFKSYSGVFGPEEHCGICLTTENKPLKSDSNNHIFHAECIDHWIKSQIANRKEPVCPIGREKITIPLKERMITELKNIGKDALMTTLCVLFANLLLMNNVLPGIAKSVLGSFVIPVTVKIAIANIDSPIERAEKNMIVVGLATALIGLSLFEHGVLNMEETFPIQIGTMIGAATISGFLQRKFEIFPIDNE